MGLSQDTPTTELCRNRKCRCKADVDVTVAGETGRAACHEQSESQLGDFSTRLFARESSGALEPFGVDLCR